MPPQTRPRRPTRPPPPIPQQAFDPSESPIGVAEDHEDRASANASFNNPPPPPPETSLGRSNAPFEDSNDQDSNTTSTLTPLRAHYLKKTLLSLELSQELDYITSTSIPPPLSTLSLFGPPFKPFPKDFYTHPSTQRRDIPFVRFMFRQFILTFPFLASAPKDFFPNKLQPFLDSLLSRNLSSEIQLFPTEEVEEELEQAGKQKILEKLERYMCLLLGGATKLVEREEVVRLTQKDLERLERIARRNARRYERRKVFDVNIVCVRNVVERGRVRNRSHEEFVIRTRRTGFEDILVSRRYGDFRTLADELRKHHPGEEIPPLPSKDRSSATPSGAQYGSSNPNHTSAASSSNLRTSKSFASLRGASGDTPPSPTNTTFTNTTTPLQRERNRLTLRSYLHQLLSRPEIGSSPVLRAFLTMDPTTLSEEEMEDARRREDLDRQREEGKKVFEREVSERVDRLRSHLKDVKGDLMGPDGLSHVFEIVREVENVKDLPPNFQAVLEWGRISLASTIFHNYVASDTASESFSALKRLHGLVPYFMMKGVLKISNPVAMIRGTMDLFMATPFGGKSLLQRMFTSSMTQEVKEFEEEIEAVKDKIEDPIICEKIRNFVYAPKEIQDVYKADAAEGRCNLLTIILGAPEEPYLTRPQWQRVARAARAHAAYILKREEGADSDSDDGPEDEDGWLYEDLSVLIRLYAQLRDREQMIELIFEGTTAELLKDIITIFYSPLAQVYKAASIADSLGDLQNFVNDLIRTVERGEEASQEDPSYTVQLFIDLVSRHEQAFYSFVHKVHSKGEGLFDSLMKWIELFLTFIRDGLSGGQEKISLEFILPHMGKEREGILKEVDEVALYHYKLKVAYEAKVRKRFHRQTGATLEEEQAAQALVDNVMGELQFGELMKGDAEDVIAEDDEDEWSEEYSDDGTGSETEEDSETMTTPSGSVSSGSSNPSSRRSSREIEPARGYSVGISRDGNGGPTPQRNQSFGIDKPLPLVPQSGDESGGSQRSSGSRPGPVIKLRTRQKTDQAVVDPPELRYIPKLLPVFVEMISQFLAPIKVTKRTQ